MLDSKINFNDPLQALRIMYEQKMPFNRVLGLRIESLEKDRVRVRFEMKERLVGNYFKKILHGGVISSVLDTTGGITASASVIRRMRGQSVEDIGTRLERVGTIDLRVDYLRPGSGDYFFSTGLIMRAGRRVTVTRMELHNDHDLLIAVGTGTYIMG